MNSSPDLIIEGPFRISREVQKYTALDPNTWEIALEVIRSRSDLAPKMRRDLSIYWPPNLNQAKAVNSINQVWEGQPITVILNSTSRPPLPAKRSERYRINGPDDFNEILRLYPEGLNWLMVLGLEAPSNQAMPELLVPLKAIGYQVGITISEPNGLRWEHFMPLYRETALVPYNEAAIRRAIIATNVEIT